MKKRYYSSKSLSLILLILLGSSHGLSVTAREDDGFEDIATAVHLIDRLVEAPLEKLKIRVQPVVKDPVFVRRVYVDIVGRIPTADEIKAFSKTRGRDKRYKLIRKLLDSEGYVNNFYNYWADILRMKTRVDRLNGQHGLPYIAWLKNTLRNNVPYDVFVRELLTAEGENWKKGNGATGYYLRDINMLEDNMSTTVQIFLGTQLQCAQCHNHPFDKWKRKEFYEMAAFTSGLRAGRFAQKNVTRVLKGIKNHKYRPQISGYIKDTGASVWATNKKTFLPKDYQYKDFRPNSMVTPVTMFDKTLSVSYKKKPRDIYANWMTSVDNPRFTTVIINRLWKKVMGRGLIEPVDQFKDDTIASNGKLMHYLTQEMIRQEFDIKKILTILFSTKAYQRPALAEDWNPEKVYHFAQPIRHRMSAEEIWDSMMTLVLPDVDERQGRSEWNKHQGAYLMLKKDPERYQKVVTEFYDGRRDVEKINSKIKELRKKLKTDKKNRDLKDQLNKLYQDKNRAGNKMNHVLHDYYVNDGPGKKSNNGDKKYAGLRPNYVRASELNSPDKKDSFLGLLGQSDRMLVQGSHRQGSVTQILDFYNGTVQNAVLNPNSKIMREATALGKSDAKMEYIFLSVLGRKYDSKEKKLFSNVLKRGGNKGTADLIWVLLNTHEFMFVD
jgi:hypothetical protein